MFPCFYTREGDAFLPTRLAASPWERGKQNGAGLGGLDTRGPFARAHQTLFVAPR